MDQDYNHPMRLYVAVALGVLVLYLTYLIFVPFFVPLFWGAVLGLLFYPLYAAVSRRLRHRGISAFLMTIGVLLVVLLPALAIAFYFALEMAEFFRQAQAYLGGGAALFDPNSAVGRHLSAITQQLGLTSQDLHGAAAFALQNVGGFLVGLGTGLIGNLVSLIINILLTLVALYFAFKDGPAFVAHIETLIPLPRPEVQRITRRLADVVQASVFSTFIVAAAQGITGGLAFWVLDLSGALLWGVVMGVVSLIPIAGAPVIWVPTAIYLAATGDWGRAATLAAIGTFIIGTIDNLLRPVLIHGRVPIHNFYLFFGVLGGVLLLGFTGFLFGPIMVSLTLTVIRIYEERRDQIAAARAAGEEAG